jgi:hypothetical protein
MTKREQIIEILESKRMKSFGSITKTDFPYIADAILALNENDCTCGGYPDCICDITRSAIEQKESKGVEEWFNNHSDCYTMKSDKTIPALTKDTFLKYAQQPQKVEQEEEKPTEYIPYFGWCDVDKCKNEGCCGGTGWRKTGYWTLCSNHSRMAREGKKQPKMKQSAVEKESKRDKKTGYLKQ